MKARVRSWDVPNCAVHVTSVEQGWSRCSWHVECMFMGTRLRRSDTLAGKSSGGAISWWRCRKLFCRSYSCASTLWVPATRFDLSDNGLTCTTNLRKRNTHTHDACTINVSNNKCIVPGFRARVSFSASQAICMDNIMAQRTRQILHLQRPRLLASADSTAPTGRGPLRFATCVFCVCVMPSRATSRQRHRCRSSYDTSLDASRWPDSLAADYSYNHRHNQESRK